MLSKFVDASGWTAEQWLAAIILAFIMVTVMVVGHRVLKIFKTSNQSSYQPNLRRLRRSKAVGKVNKAP
mgnify:FL=1